MKKINSYFQIQMPVRHFGTLIILLAVLFLFSWNSSAQTTTIQKTQVSGCYYYAGASKTTISVQVGWTGANSSDIITVRIDGGTPRIINTEDMYDPGIGSAIAGPMKSPQVVAYEINADGLPHTITAVMTGTHSSSAVPVVVTAPGACIPMGCSGTNLGGMIYYDNNADGIHQAGESNGVPGITITAFDVNGAIYTATSDASGRYAFSSANGNAIPAGVYPVRVEFTDFPAGVFGNSGPSITGNKSSVRFVNAPMCSLDCGAVNPLNYSQSNPKVISNLYTNNNPLGGGSAGTTPALIAHNYNNNTNYNFTTLATSAQIGSVWAKAWNKFQKKMLVAAFLKRHSGFGPLGIGGLYMVDYTVPATPVFSNFIDVTTLGINVGQANIPSNVARGMGAVKTNPNTDEAAFAYVGKAGIGNMDFSEDGNILYLMNLFDRKVYSINLTAYFANGTMPTAANVTSITIPNPGCSNGNYRPFALKVYEGKMYVGMVCDAGNAGATTSSMAAYIKAMDLTTDVWTDVFDFPLTYPKGYPDQQDGSKTGWYVWSDNPANVWNGSGSILHPVPILSDIEFDLDGAMVIALMDRTAHQYGNYNNDNWDGSNFYGGGEFIAAGGDILRAYYSNGAYVLENNAKAGPNTGYGPNNNQGPGFGEFYNDNINGGQNYHTEMGTGGLTLLPGSGEVMAGMVDPSFYMGGPLYANGVRRMSNSTGLSTGGMSYYTDNGISSFGKANGMGDVELASDNVNYIELGNFVWSDVNNDGIQGSNETGVAGVVLKIYNSATGALVATDTTDVNGNYYFSTLAGVTLLPNTTYKILAGEGQFNGADNSLVVGGNVYSFSPANVGQGSSPDINDNDFSALVLSTALGSMPAGYPVFTVTTGNYGYINHTIDLGIKACAASAGPDISLNCTTPSGIIGTVSSTGNAYSWLPVTGLNNATIAQPTASPLVTTTYTLTVNGVCSDMVTVTVNKTPPAVDAGPNVTLNCNVTSATIGTAAIAGNTYSWSPAAGLSNPGIAQPVASPAATTTYTLTVTGANGCTATDVVTVNKDITTPAANAGPDQTLTCSITSVTIGTAAVAGNSYSWLPAYNISNTSIAQPVVNPAVPTTYTVTVTGSNGCTATDAVSVNINTAPPAANAGPDQLLNCNITSATIGSAAVAGNTYSWLPATGLNNASAAQPVASPAVTTTYTVTVTAANGCTATDVVTVSKNITPPTANAGPDHLLNCSTTSATIGTTAIAGNTYSWLPAYNINNAAVAQPVVNPVVPTTYTVTVTGTNGCTATDVVFVNVNIAPPVADAGPDHLLNCSTTSATIGTTAIAGNTYSWSPAYNINNINIAQPVVSPVVPTTYTVTVTGSNGCTATDVVFVNVDIAPPTADAGPDHLLNCSITSATIGTPAIAGNSYNWLPAYNINNTTIAQPVVSPLVPTTYTVTVTGSNGCTATDVVFVNVDIAPPFVDAGVDQNLDCITTSTIIGTAALPGYTYLWTPATGLSATNVAQPVATPTSKITYTVTATSANGCTATSYVTLNVDNVPPVAATSGNLIVCNGSLTVLTATGGVSYLWSNNDTTASTTVGAGTYTVTVTGANGCTATTSATVINLRGSVGNYVWNDINHNGINDEAPTAGINGVPVELWNSVTNTLEATTITANDINNNPGYYNFVICNSGDYKVKFPIANVPGMDRLTIQTNAAATDNNSDAGLADGFSPVFTIDVSAAGIAKDNNTIDAGYYKFACLGNYVWNDKNQNGIQDNVEVGVAGITVTLYNAVNNTIQATMATDAYGRYQFCGLIPGAYKVGFSLPANYVFTSANNANDFTDSDPSIITGYTQDYFIASGDSNMTIDAGIYEPQPSAASVGDRVWFDANGDGLQDAAEQGVSGITVSLFHNGDPAAITITDANGYYLFENVTPGNYSVSFSAPMGTMFTTNDGLPVSDADNSDANPANGQTDAFTVNAGDHIRYVDAGIVLQPSNTASIGDWVWNDANQDGNQDAGETGVAGVTVTLYTADGITVIRNTTTDALGQYNFSGLTPGCYVVGFSDLPAGYTLSPFSEDADTAKNSDANILTGKTNQICVSAGQKNPTIDAGIYNAANTNSIGDKVWYDANKNGLQDAVEYGYPGVVVTLYNLSGNILGVTTTNANGNYLFDGLANGTYYLGFGFMTGFQFTGANSDMAGILGGVNSDANPSNGMTQTVSLTGNTHITTVDAGIYPGGNRSATSSLGDRVWQDVNNNGLQDNGETGVPGVTVTLYEEDGTPVANTVTDGMGNYIFTNLTGGIFKIGFTNIPAGYTFTTQSGNIDDASNSDANTFNGMTSSVTLGLGEDKMTVDAGLILPPLTVCLGNFVWIDVNHNGLQDAAEPAVPGITVKLYDNTNTVIGTATTDAAGKYLFCGLSNGSVYSVGFENLPAGYTFTTATGILDDVLNSDADENTGRTTPVTIGATDNLNIDAGIYSATTAVVGNYVWYDADADGLQDANEAAIAGVLVTLYDNTNTAVASAVTDANGGYLFTNVLPGDYTIGFTGYSANLIPTTKGVVANADDDSNIDPVTGKTDIFTVTPGSSNLTLDAGYKANAIAGLGNYVWLDVNETGIQDAAEPPLAGILVTLYDADNLSEKGVAITDGNGLYSFPNLTQGDYIVGFGNIPMGHTRTVSDGLLNDPLNSDINADNKTSVVSLAAGTYNPNVDAGFYIGAALPAKSLTATVAIIRSENKCDVNWFTTDELNTKDFYIERSLDAKVFKTVGSIPASTSTLGRTNYFYTDDIEAVSKAKVIFYRIRLNDQDNQYSYSNTISVAPQTMNEEAVVIYPSPFTDKLSIDYNTLAASELEIELTDLSGRAISRELKMVEAGLNKITLNNLGSLSAANYFIRIKDINSGETFIRKVAK